MEHVNFKTIDWSKESKQKARYDTIIHTYRSLFSRSIPSDRQYWSMCGVNADENGQILEGHEFDQITKSKLIKPYQFIGIEKDQEIYEQNKQIQSEATWKCGDFYTECLKAGSSFNPSIVNIDTTKMIRKACKYLSRILRLIKNDDVLVVLNSVRKYRQKINSDEEITKALESDNYIPYCLSKKWKLYSQDGINPSVYNYHANGNNNNYMTTIILYNKK